MNNKKALIIGGTSGIGLSLAELFAKKNYEVIIASSNKDNLKRALEKLKKINNNCSYIKCNLTIQTEVENLIQNVIVKEKNLECIILSSSKGLFGKIHEIGDKQFLDYFQTFVVSYIKILKSVFNNNRYKNRDKIRIIYLSSYVAHFNILNYIAYSFIKSTIDNFLDKIRTESKDGQILTVYPGSVDTDFDKKSDKVGLFRFKTIKKKTSKSEIAEKIFKSYKNNKNVLHNSIIMSFLFFIKNTFQKLLNNILKIFF